MGWLQVNAGEIRISSETPEAIETDIFPNPFLYLALRAWAPAYVHKDTSLLNAPCVVIKVLFHGIPEAKPWYRIAFEFGLCGVKPCWC
jgi:hypothetical protein